MPNHTKTISIGEHRLVGDLCRVPRASGLVVFAHGSGSSRLSGRNRQVAQSLQQRGLDTLLFDLLTEEEAANRDNVFDIELLAARVGEALDAVDGRVPAQRIGLFGASTGAAAALVAAARRPDVAAVVSRGGRPDLARAALPDVRAPTLLIVGAADVEVLALNREAYAQMRCEKRLEIVPRATHLFAEAGALETVAILAGDWFVRHLGAAQ
ncbi:dienelactone hydrolase family protein [Caldimonas sp. KR1-144]|uniref:dienelactone hydrolase family protein n=1 Tax=Caldimonas sp. KR1-144 TaxID=3400911 RepID=UPI003C0857AD